MSDDIKENPDEIRRDELFLPDFEIDQKDGVCTVFVDSEGVPKSDVLGTEQILSVIMDNQNGYRQDLSKTLNPDKHQTNKSFENSTQSEEELGEFGSISQNYFDGRIQEPPYDPNCFSKFLELSEVHAKCVKVKVRDSVGRNYNIKAAHPIYVDDAAATLGDDHGMSISSEEFEKDCTKITNFIEKCNSNEDFTEICYKVGMDKEAIGWGAFEVIREGSGKIARLQHLPATRLRVLSGFEGFVEEIPQTFNNAGRRMYKYYQPFGKKFGKYVDDPFDLNSRAKKIFRPYDPDKDGELELGNDGLTFNLVDKDTGKPLKGKIQSNFKKAANEVLFIPNTHSSTIYYGYSDIVPAIGAIIANVHIRDYLLQFFEHNCIPRYAVVIKGAKVDDKFLALITDYFENKIKGSAHKTIILALTGYGNKNVEIEFQDLSSGVKEADFINTKKSNDQQIMVAHGVPPHVLGITEAASLGSGKGTSQTDSYKNRVILPLQIFWESRLNKLFSLGLGVKNAYLEFDGLDLRDNQQLVASINLLLNSGVITINEARRMLMIEGTLSGGDTPVVKIRDGSAMKVEDLPKLQMGGISAGKTGPPPEKDKIGIPTVDIELDTVVEG